MSAGHTPGPWATRDMGPWSVDSEYGGSSSWAVGAEHEVVAIAVTHHYHDDPVFTANARLIAAAPELLDALQEAVSQYGKQGGPWNVPSDPGGWLERARAAVLKAKGEA